MSFLRSVHFLLRHHIVTEWSERERIISLLLFALNLLLLFWFAASDIADKFPVALFTAQSYLTIFVALQIAFVRLFEPEELDRAFDQLVISPLNYSAWYISKLLGALVSGVFLVFPTLLISAYFAADAAISERVGDILLVGVVTMVSLSSVGVLLSALVIRANARQILFPLLYFPLAAPVLLTAVNATMALINDGATFSDMMSSWFGLLLIFNVLYLSLGTVFYGDLVRS